MEEEARKKFNIGRPGEELLIITEKKGAVITTEEKGESLFDSMWQKLKGSF